MAQRLCPHNFPAALRALADICQVFPYVGSSIHFLDIRTSSSCGTPGVDIAFSVTYVGHMKDFRILFALAYEKHGGDPLLFIDQLQYDHAKAAVNQL